MKEHRIKKYRMNTPVEISSLADYINQIDAITDPEKSYLYRGQENETWRITSSAYRRLVSSSEDLGREDDLLPYPLRDLYQNYLLEIIDEIKLMGISEKTLFSDLLGFFERNSATQPYNLSVDALDS